jgi:hypothetical protein
VTLHPSALRAAAGSRVAAQRRRNVSLERPPLREPEEDEDDDRIFR